MPTNDVQQQLSEALQRLSSQHEQQLQTVYDEMNLLREKLEELGQEKATQHLVGGSQSGYKSLPQDVRLKFELVEKLVREGKASGQEKVYLCEHCKHCMIRQQKASSSFSYRCLIDGEEGKRYFDCNQFEYYKS